MGPILGENTQPGSAELSEFLAARSPDELDADWERFDRIRQKLIRYFAARRFYTPEDLADVVIYRAFLCQAAGKILSYTS